MNVLIACEESQRVCIAFRENGHNAFSCDLLPCSGAHPEWHIQGDVLKILNGKCQFVTQNGDVHFLCSNWDIIVAFPPCTFLTVTGNSWFNVNRYGDKAIARVNSRNEAIKFFMDIANADCELIAIENPVGIMSSVWKKPTQIIHPWQFGDPFEKRTCLWLKGVPELMPTNIVNIPPRKIFDSGVSMPAWYAELWKMPSQERALLRSKTFPGIANAMAVQWGNDLNFLLTK